MLYSRKKIIILLPYHPITVTSPRICCKLIQSLQVVSRLRSRLTSSLGFICYTTYINTINMLYSRKKIIILLPYHPITVTSPRICCKLIQSLQVVSRLRSRLTSSLGFICYTTLTHLVVVLPTKTWRPFEGRFEQRIHNPVYKCEH